LDHGCEDLGGVGAELWLVGVGTRFVLCTRNYLVKRLVDDYKTVVLTSVDHEPRV